MTTKQNCWEFKECHRELGGTKAEELGTCPAATDMRADGVHGGKSGGRACWALAGTLCGGVVQGSFASKLGNCLRCEFYQEVTHAEGTALMSPSAIQKLLG